MKSTTEVAKAVVQAVKEAVGSIDNARRVPTANASLGTSAQTLQQSMFKWKATDKNHEVVNSQMEVSNIFMMNYGIGDSEKVPVNMNWLDCKGLHFFQTITEEKNANQVQSFSVYFVRGLDGQVENQSQ